MNRTAALCEESRDMSLARGSNNTSAANRYAPIFAWFLPTPSCNMLKVKKLQSIQTGDGIYYFTQFDHSVGLQLDGARLNIRDSDLPDNDNEALFF